ncbi:MAG: hypothetical protein H7296_15395 [Bacteroidia bacterium]|nr:hypothetical protein [Bacteroidia bacterium]
MHFEHEKHQYFFEKFLRNEMRGQELAAFHQKLNENERFRKDFDFYVIHRKNILEEELAEYDKNEILFKKPQKWGWFYAIISVLGLVLIIDYYLSINYDKTIDTAVRRKPLIERINFFSTEEIMPEPKETEKAFKENKIEKPLTKNYSTEPEILDSTQLFAEAEAQLEKYIQNNNIIQSDYFLMDSLMWVFDGIVTKERIVALNMQTDSILDDSSLQMLAFKSLYGKPKASQKQLFVEYWKSPIHFRGYRFSGKKLLLFGFETDAPLFFSFDEPAGTYYLFMMDKAYSLFSDNQFHKISKE